MDVFIDPASAPPAPAAAAAEVSRGDGPSLREMMGVHDEFDLDDVKPAAQVMVEKKKPKLTQDHFFEDEEGLKKLVKVFPRIRFKGKGHEFEDLKVLLGNYERFFQQLFPQAGHLEDAAWKARSVLQERENETDPKEKLHMFRAVYKQGGGGGTIAGRAAVEKDKAAAKKGPSISDDIRKRIEANKQRALELRRLREAGQGGGAAAAPSAGPAAGSQSAAAIEDPRQRIEANRARALELKRRRQEEAEAAALEAAFAEAQVGPPELPPDFDEEDVFGFGGSLGAQQGTRSTAAGHSGGMAPAPAQRHAAAMFDEEEDPFGFGFDMDVEPSQQPRPPHKPAGAATSGPAGNKAVASCPPASFDVDEEDPFGFGFDMDVGPSQQPRPPHKPAAPAAACPPASFDVDEEDPFGFGFDMEEGGGGPLPPPQPPQQPQPSQQTAGAATSGPTAGKAPAARPPPSFDEESDPFGHGFDMDE